MSHMGLWEQVVREFYFPTVEERRERSREETTTFVTSLDRHLASMPPGDHLVPHLRWVRDRAAQRLEPPK